MLTPRDRSICRLLDEHRVLTVHQLQDGFFDSSRCARQRLTTLYRLGVVDRFRPYCPNGSACYHYVLGDVGVVIQGLERGDDPATVRRDASALRMAYSQRLGHLVAVNEFFTSLLGAARRSGGSAELVEWWSERRCAGAMGGLVYPDGYGVWRTAEATVEFCVEIDRGTETLGRVAGKLDGYRKLEAASGVRRWVLFVLPTARREAEVRRAVGSSALLVATAVGGQESAAAIWQPIRRTGQRMKLAELAA